MNNDTAAILLCPSCDTKMIVSEHHKTISCASCMRSFLYDQEIPLLFWPNKWDNKHDVTEIVKSFYEKNPFPNYEDIDSGTHLRQKAQKGIFARLLDEHIGYDAKILEAGCGTGQLSNFLASGSGRHVWATDICVSSLKLGHEFMLNNKINGVNFVQMNLFQPVFQPASFDVVISNGVLHHTSDPKLAFQTLVQLVKPGGYIIIGLYNTYGRVWTDIRRFIFKLTGKKFRFLDEQVRQKKLSNLKKHIWFADQYQHPHESKHTFGEVLGWFKQSEVEYINSIPKAQAFEVLNEKENIFQKNSQGTILDRFLVQLGMLLKGREGGFFVMIGKKK